jgi:hypothetical protein
MRQTAVSCGLLFSGFLLSGVSAFAADPQLMNLVMPDAKILAGMNVTSARISPLGQFIISKFGLNSLDQFKFVATTGFNPLQDVSEVLVATAADPATPGFLLLARGTFQVDKIVAAINGSATNGPQVQTYGGDTLISVTNPKEKTAHAVAFVGNSIAVAGDLASVKAAIDRSSAANSIDPALAVKVNQLSGSEDEWLVSSTSVASLLPASATADAKGPAVQILPLLKNIQSFNGGLKFSDNVTLTGEAVTSDPKNAAALQAVIKLGLALVGSSAGKGDPQLAQVIQLLQGLQVTLNGPAVELALAIPEAQIESLVNSVPAARRGTLATAQRRSPEHNGN